MRVRIECCNLIARRLHGRHKRGWWRNVRVHRTITSKRAEQQRLMHEIDGEAVASEERRARGARPRGDSSSEAVLHQRVTRGDAEQQHAGPREHRHVILGHRLVRHESEPAEPAVCRTAATTASGRRRSRRRRRAPPRGAGPVNGRATDERDGDCVQHAEPDERSRKHHHARGRDERCGAADHRDVARPPRSVCERIATASAALMPRDQQERRQWMAARAVSHSGSCSKIPPRQSEISAGRNRSGSMTIATIAIPRQRVETGDTRFCVSRVIGSRARRRGWRPSRRALQHRHGVARGS